MYYNLILEDNIENLVNYFMIIFVNQVEPANPIKSIHFYAQFNFLS